MCEPARAHSHVAPPLRGCNYATLPNVVPVVDTLTSEHRPGCNMRPVVTGSHSRVLTLCAHARALASVVPAVAAQDITVEAVHGVFGSRRRLLQDESELASADRPLLVPGPAKIAHGRVSRLINLKLCPKSGCSTCRNVARKVLPYYGW